MDSRKQAELEKARKLVKKLRADLERHEKLYREGRPEISDWEFDTLLADLKSWEERYPELKEGTSPTQKVGDDRNGDFPKEKHLQPMLSLDNSYNAEELKAFDERLKRALGMDLAEELSYVVEPKIDGVGISVVYENGVLTRALTRGDGEEGDVVTENFLTIAGVPTRLPSAEKFPAVLELRGEIYLTHAQFEEINARIKLRNDEKRRQNVLDAQNKGAQKTLFGDSAEPANLEKGLEIEYANPRNLAAGTLKLKDDTEEVRRRGLKVIFYAAGEGCNHWETQEALLKFLRQNGWPTQEWWRVSKGSAGAWEAIEELDKVRKDFGYPTDGAVLKLNSRTLQKEAGFTARSPRWAFAYKYKPDSAETLLKGITIQVGRTGVLTPVAELNPVELSGSTIARVTLHNADEIARKDIRVGDIVIVEKAGEVIPKINAVRLDKRPADSVPYEFPRRCPECGSMAVRYEGEVAWRCVNEDCKGRLKRSLEYFASRNAMAIDELGEKVIEQLVDRKLLKNISGIYALTIADLLSLPGFAQKSALNLFNAIEKSKQNDLWRFVNALGIPQVGETVAQLLASEFGSLEKLEAATILQLESLHGIGKSMAESIYAFFQQEDKRAELESFKRHGLKLTATLAKKSDGPLKGQKWVLTGELSSMNRNDAKTALEGLGATVVDSVSKNTTALVAGESAGSKLQKAQSLGVKIYTENEFLNLLKIEK